MKRQIKKGTFTMLVLLIVIAAVIGANIGVSKLPSSWTKKDMTGDEVYSLSNQSEKIAKAIDQDVTMYLLAPNGSEDTALWEYLKRYADLNSKISIEQIDTDLYPNFASQYTEDEVTANSVIVVSGERSRYVDNGDIYTEEYDYTTYYQTYDQDDIIVTSTFDGEQQLTSALHYVTTEDLPKLYILKGHGEGSLSDYSTSLEASITADNIETDGLNLISTGEVPEDADCILILDPATDLSDDEVTMLTAYIDAGGKLMVLWGFTDTELPNFKKVLAEFNVETVDGIVIEGNSSNYYQYPSFLMPEMEYHTITYPISSANYSVMLPNCQGIQVIDEEDTDCTVSSILTTSEDAFSKVDGYNITTYEKEKNDIDGPFSLGVAVTKTLTTDTDADAETETDTASEDSAQLVYISSVYFISDEFNQLVSGANADLFLNSVEWLCQQDETISLRSKDIRENTFVAAESVETFYKVLFMVIIPVGILVAGGIICYRRKGLPQRKNKKKA
jgi:ABC-2 type transport system permease protein